MKQTEPRIIELNAQEAEELKQRLEASPLSGGDCEVLCALIDSHIYLAQLLEQKNISINRLKKALFGASTEKAENVLGSEEEEQDSPSSDEDKDADGNGETDIQSDPQSDAEADSSKRPKGHGRNGADDYRGAERIDVGHESLQPKDPCPECWEGTLYKMDRPGRLIRFVGQPPVKATVCTLERLRCNLCETVFTAEPPEEAWGQRRDPTVASMIGLLKYGSGLPFNRLAGLQGNLGVPLPASTQWEIVRDQACFLALAHEELIRQAAQGQIVYHDDTDMKVLEMMRERARETLSAKNSSRGAGKKQASDRTGMFTSGIVSVGWGRRIALFFTGRQHAGENVADVLTRRAEELKRPIQMCDPLSRNMPAELDTILANCLAHGRRQFVDIAEAFPESCRYVIEALKKVYKNEETIREEGRSPEARLEFHQTHSGPTMDKLHSWLNEQFDKRLVEPNSGLGKAITYMLKHWDRMTLFLREPGAPLDNNLCERALKKAILHRKNSYFYKTPNGARVGDIYMSLIYTCELCGVNPFDYLTALDRHHQQVAAAPARWMPWNYHEVIDDADTSLQTAS